MNRKANRSVDIVAGFDYCFAVDNFVDVLQEFVMLCATGSDEGLSRGLSVYQEPQVVLPDLEKPVIVTRDLTVIVSGKKRKSGVPGFDPSARADYICLSGVSLTVLVNERLYLVCHDEEFFRRGQVLSRNLDLTIKNGGTLDNPASQCFIVYDGINDARRGIGKIDKRYKEVESPMLAQDRKEIDWMMRQAWVLHKEGADERTYIWVAEALLTRQRSVKNPKKVQAREKIEKAATRMDKIPRRNTGMIPLLTAAADDRLFARMQDIRGIGRKMDWRHVVLEHYIDQLRSKCLEIQSAVEHRLKADTVFGARGTEEKMRTSASRMFDYAKHLRTFHARPFTRALAHAADELETASSFMHKAVEDHHPAMVENAKSVLRRIYRSMRMLEYQWLMEEVLVIVSEASHWRKPLAGTLLTQCVNELTEVKNKFDVSDFFTKEPLEQGFKLPVLSRVRGNLEKAIVALQQQAGTPAYNGHTKTARLFLKEACAPF